MAELGAGSLPLGDPAFNYQEHELNERLKRLYPAVNEDETPLPRSWSPKDKYSYIGLSQNNLRVHYKGHDCQQGRDGYMGIGLSAQGVNMNRLPGWDKHSYGYHGDDGHSFCSSGTGQPYGPTFTTGDVIGCCVNLINNTCFYTKNGISLGVAFTDLPPNLYPTVGLQTPGEIVDANFGQQPFVFDIEDYMSEWRAKIHGMIARFPIGERLGEWQAVLQNMVSSYLVHHGYCATATAFARATETMIQEDQTSIKNRQRIQKLVLAGRVGEAIEATQQLYPGLLEHNPNLLFMLKCRQFVEMVNGTDSEVRCLTIRSPKSQDSYPGSPSLSPRHGASNTHLHTGGADSPTCSNGVTPPNKSKSHSGTGSSSVKYPSASSSASSSTSSSPSSVNYSESNSSDSTKSQPHSANSTQETSDRDGDGTPIDTLRTLHKHEEILPYQDQQHVVAVNALARLRLHRIPSVPVHSSPRFSWQEVLQQHPARNSRVRPVDAFSLLAYSDPWNCPVGQQLDPTQRESLCSALNSAILESQNLPKQPPLMLALALVQVNVK
ncbi:ran-binding protein 10 [Lates japonicus]|uniref:Ran-binding protein 10 n=1 Tax=Lates japonicus TaxID=270547 RepID=A0AAD3RFI9_LATJO|nr:ran-binding protein 10 [Lates japonicus]